MKRTDDKQRGFVLILVLVGFVLLGVMGVTFAISQRAQIQEARSVQLAEDIVSLRDWFELGHDCPRTMALNPGVCGAGYIAIGRAGVGASTPLITFTSPDTYTVIGNYRVRVTCTGSNPKTFQVEAQSIAAGTNSPWKKLYPNAPVTCS